MSEEAAKRVAFILAEASDLAVLGVRTTDELEVEASRSGFSVDALPLDMERDPEASCSKAAAELDSW